MHIHVYRDEREKEGEKVGGKLETQNSTYIHAFWHVISACIVGIHLHSNAYYTCIVHYTSLRTL